MKKYFLALFATAAISATYAQIDMSATTGNKAAAQLTQTVRGIVTDAESKQPLPGVVVVLVSDNKKAAVTDENGYFSITGIPVGRSSFLFSYMGFEPYTASEVPVISGKELQLNVSLRESLKQLDEVTISAHKDKARPINEFATVSARSFSVEETRRYAASFADPARMVMNFPGVSNAGDGDNGIVVRGNSPKGVLWRLEGIEIPNPNHFTAQGTSGGAISMLNANTLGNSDFYTGAFVPEIGNALSGAFDLNLRNGNTERYEHTVQVGTLGVEVATEGPFQKGKKASYLFNYRYSTLALLKDFIGLGAQLPDYQDASFKLFFPTEKAGTFTVFGLGGYNKVYQNAEPDSAKWDADNTNISFDNKAMMGVAGVSHQIFIDKESYIKTIVSASYDKATTYADTLNVTDAYRKVPVENSDIRNTAYRVSLMYNRKINARNTFRAGAIGQQLAYDMNYEYFDGADKRWKDILTGDGSTQYYQAYLQLKSRLSEKLTMVAGAHGSYYALNGKYSVEPRASFSYQLTGKDKVTLASGLHSKPEHISTYMFQDGAKGQNFTYPNKNLDLLRAFHTVLGYETVLPWNLRLKVETYYQHLYSIPVAKDSIGSFSIINAESAYSLLGTNPLVSEGTGRNYGIDVSFERPFANSFYAIVAGSVYKSTYVDYMGKEYNTRFNRGHQLNIIAGKEFKLTASGKKVLGLNGKILYSGGMREPVIDVTKSVSESKTVYVPGSYFTVQNPAYFRTDIGVYYKFNTRRATHSIQLDVQNVTNRANYYFSYFDAGTGAVKQVNQLGLLPNLSYRIDFHW